MSTDKILYYPYINIPNTLWTSRALLYWDNIGVIVPQDYISNPEKLEPHMLELVSAQLVEQIIPKDYTQNFQDFSSKFIRVLLSSDIVQKRNAFERGNYLKIHVEKFDGGLMNNLACLGLAQIGDWPWWKVEEKTAKMLMTYLASIISLIDERTAVTDEVEQIPKRKFLINKKSVDDKMYMRNKLLNDILPLPTQIGLRDLEKIKNKYSKELLKFRNNIEKIIIDLSHVEHTKDFETRYKLQIEEILDAKDFIIDKLKGPKFGKIVFGTLCSIGATGIAVVQTNRDQLIWTIPSVLAAAYSVIEGYKKSDIRNQQPLSYLALIDKQLK